jgi:hypothetical protein
MNKTEGRYKVEVIADNSGKWCSNALRFDDVDSALVYGQDLAWRWTLVRKFRVFDTETDAPVEGAELEVRR